jgi:hypothetical protein
VTSRLGTGMLITFFTVYVIFILLLQMMEPHKHCIYEAVNCFQCLFVGAFESMLVLGRHCCLGQPCPPSPTRGLLHKNEKRKKQQVDILYISKTGLTLLASSMCCLCKIRILGSCSCEDSLVRHRRMVCLLLFDKTLMLLKFVSWHFLYCPKTTGKNIVLYER